MSYSRQLPILITDRDLNFSGKALEQLNENHLDEITGVMSNSPMPEEKIVYGPLPPIVLPYTGDSVDWNQDGQLSADVVELVHYLESQGCVETSPRLLSGYNDWENLNFNSRGTSNWADSTLDNACKFGTPRGAGPNTVCVPPRMPGEPSPEGDNAVSKWYPDFKFRTFVHGAEEMTYEDVRHQHELKVLALQDELLRLTPSHFIDNKSQEFKKTIRSDFKEVFGKIKNNDFKGSIQKLDNIGKSFVDVKKDNGMKEEFNQSTLILEALEDIKKAQNALLDLPPNIHPPSEISPLSEIPPEKIICEDKVWLESKKGRIACVTPSTAEKLIQRGWGNYLE